MNLTEKVKQKPNSTGSSAERTSEEMFIVLYNDDVNTFNFVIESLIEVCKHKPEQAEQCAIITHFKGKCDVKKGTYYYLKPMKDGLISKGLSAVIE
ncbi:MAG: Clp protease ClpS [Bacteroidetes bacterium CG23_combo_of_CG06-09_8_20_14_all_32_9]|nr:MAG: Clp protease ClpS [Bacteroidetes bacterium CG23_combo_of_CG06-09_8_20_14_all_32_9]